MLNDISDYSITSPKFMNINRICRVSSAYRSLLQVYRNQFGKAAYRPSVDGVYRSVYNQFLHHSIPVANRFEQRPRFCKLHNERVGYFRPGFSIRIAR